jgi:hypothetical protein
LVAADSPRLDGENTEYAMMLAESESTLPPIIVHRKTMQVIDGMHRLRAAQLRGEKEILVQLFEGDLKDAFVLAVKANNSHGLPLSSADRTAAAERIIRSHPQWSDRAIASAAGLAAKTVAAVRRRATGDGQQLDSRIGRDGRVRPVSTAEARRVASEYVADKPEASLREIARVAGISPGTARDVRDRLRRGEDPVLKPRVRQRPQTAASAPCDAQQDDTAYPAPPQIGVGRRPLRSRAGRAWPTALDTLKRDPSLRFNDMGRLLLRLLDLNSISPDQLDQLVDGVPPHCATSVLNVAQECAGIWQDFASKLDQRRRTSA